MQVVVKAEHRYWYSDEKQDEMSADVDKLVAAMKADGIGVMSEESSVRRCRAEFLMTAEQFALFTIRAARREDTHGQFEFSILRTVDHDPQAAQHVFTRAADKAAPQGPTERHWNSRVEVHMPGQALSTYNEVLLMEDQCSDALQDALNQGWRIISVCPQPDQRRPDYILGRFNPKTAYETSAARYSDIRRSEVDRVQRNGHAIDTDAINEAHAAPVHPMATENNPDDDMPF